MSNREREPSNTAALRATARAVLTSTAARSTATQSSQPHKRGSVTAVTTPRMASTTASSAREKPRRMARELATAGRQRGTRTMQRTAKTRGNCGLTQLCRKSYVVGPLDLHRGTAPAQRRGGGHHRLQLRSASGMPGSRLKFESLPHAIFLQRVTAQSPATSLEARLGQGAFLALRLVDLLAPDREPVSPDAFHYQWIATDRFCRELRAAATEGAHVHGIAASAADAHPLSDSRPLAPALLADAPYLEDAMRFDEALDVLWTLVQVGDTRLSSPDAVAGRLRMARVNRKQNRFDEAEAAYVAAGALPAPAGRPGFGPVCRAGRGDTTPGPGHPGPTGRLPPGRLPGPPDAGP